MKIRLILSTAAAIATCGSAALAEEAGAERDVKLAGDATLYGGEISDPTAPVAGGDAKVFLDLTGKAAQRIFELMGRAAQTHGACEEPGVTVRQRGVVSCMHDQQGYACYLAYDLKSGKAILQAVC